jgi:hypothetical protein
MGMAAADAEPNDVGPAFARERAEADEREEERFPLDGGEMRFQIFGIVR